MDVVLAVVREIVVDDVAYILDVFHQEANVELGIQQREIHDAYRRVQST